MSVATSRYAMIIDWSDEDQVFVVTVPDLPGCRTHGKTYAEAARKGQEVIDAWIDAQAARGRPAPAARHAGIGEYFNPLARLAGETPPAPPWDVSALASSSVLGGPPDHQSAAVAVTGNAKQETAEHGAVVGDPFRSRRQ